MSRPSSNPLFLPETSNDLRNAQTSRNDLTPSELEDIKFFLSGAKSLSMTLSDTRLSGRRVLVPVTSKALFEGNLEPSMSSGPKGAEELIVVHLGDGKYHDMSREEARKLFDTFDVRKSEDVNTTKQQQKEMSCVTANGKDPINSTIETKPATSHDSSLDDDLPLIEIREEWDESNTGLVRSEVVNISKQMERLNAGLKQTKNAENNDENGKQFGELLVNLLKSGDDDVQISNIPTDTTKDRRNTSCNTQPEIPTQSKVSDEEYKAIYSRLEELERLEEMEASGKKNTSSKKSRSSKNSQGWSKGFLNVKPKTKQSRTDEQKSIPRTESTKITNDVKMPMKQPVTKHAGADGKTSKVSFSKDVNVKEISPRAATVGREPNYFSEAKEVNPFPPIETVPFDDNVFSGVVRERASSKFKPAKDSNRDGEKKLSRFAMQRLERGL
jgi:hypothetical protein